MTEEISLPSDFSHELGRIIIENVRDFAIFAIDLHGRILSWNPGVQNLLGYGEDEFVGKHVSIIFTPEDVRQGVPHKEIKTAKSTGRAEDTRWQRRKDGTRFFANGMMMPLKDKDENVVALTKIMRDDTKRRQIEGEREETLLEERQARAAIEYAYQANSDFLRLLSHELRNPINTILGWTRMLQTDYLDEEQKARALKTIERSGRLQSRLLEDVFDLSRITSGKLHLHTKEMDLSEVVNQAQSAILPLAAAKAITVDSKTGVKKISINGDPDRIHQAVSNLLSNAVKFTQEGGRIIITLKQSGKTVRVIVRDNGPGISRKHLQTIFEPYNQVNEKLVSKESGLGLGLTLVKQIVEMHGGTIVAESQERGACFTITLPISKSGNN